MINTLRLSKNKIIITSTQYPRYGGAATAAYEFHKYLINNNMESLCIFFDNTSYSDPKKLNPDSYPNVYGEKLPRDYDKMNDAMYLNIIAIAKKLYNHEPYNIYGFNYLAPILSKKIFVKSKIYYLITGCSYISNDNLIDATTFLKQDNICNTNITEKATIQISDVIVPNSELTKNIVEHVYKIYIDKYIDLHEIFYIENNSEENEKINDIVFICSNFRRNVKNVNLVKKIIADKKLQKYRKICIGTNSTIVKTGNIPNLHCIDFLPQNDIIDVLKKTKVVIVPSYIESYSITAIEATQCNCVVVCSKNTATAATMNKYFVMDNYDSYEWIIKIDNILKNFDYFRKIYYNNYTKTAAIENLWTGQLINQNKINILFVSVDIPYIGGAATNLYNLIKKFYHEDNFNVHGIFFSNLTDNHNPEGIPNIYKICMDKDVIKNLNTIRSLIYQKVKLDIVFCKNYKIMPYIKNIFHDVKIIFSPSGLRNMSTNPDNDYINNLDLKNINNKLAPPPQNSEDLYNYVTENDAKLDYYALVNSDIIIPNSNLTYNIIKKLYGNLINLHYPISITNISLTEIKQDSFINRNIDIMFCCISWKRKCKNYELVQNIVNDAKMMDKRITIVGTHQTATYHNNVTKYDYLDNNKLMEILTNVKVVVVPSKFDSNPNILIEAIRSGCNVVTSINVGNNENLKLECIVKNYMDKNNWIETIERCLLKRYDFNGPYADKIMERLKNLFISQRKNKMAVSIYKIPPDISNNTLIQQKFDDNYFDFVEAFDETFVKDIADYDIYFILFVELAMREECTDVNYIIYDSTITQNLCYNVYKVYPFYNNRIKIWKIKDLKSLMFFKRAQFYFMRGNYHEFYKIFIPTSAKSVLYPATAANQCTNNRIVPKNPYPFHTVLVHEDPIYNEIFSSSKCVRFNKFSSDHYINNNLERIYDLCFVATERQPTKNHHLFFALLEFLDQKSITINAIYIGDITLLLQKHNMVDFAKRLKHIKLSTKNSCNKQELGIIYNKSRINMIFSGRDSDPRVIYESSACGCFNIALDTLSDGKEFYDGYLGVLVGDPNTNKIILEASSLSYQPTESLFEKIKQYIKINYDHKNISLYFKKKYNLKNTLLQIYK